MNTPQIQGGTALYWANGKLTRVPTKKTLSKDKPIDVVDIPQGDSVPWEYTKIGKVPTIAALIKNHTQAGVCGVYEGEPFYASGAFMIFGSMTKTLEKLPETPNFYEWRKRDLPDWMANDIENLRTGALKHLPVTPKRVDRRPGAKSVLRNHPVVEMENDIIGPVGKFNLWLIERVRRITKANDICFLPQTNKRGIKRTVLYFTDPLPGSGYRVRGIVMPLFD